MVFSCKGCEKRYPGCHGKCEDYKADKDKYNAAKEAISKQRDLECAFHKQHMRAVARARHRRIER